MKFRSKRGWPKKHCRFDFFCELYYRLNKTLNFERNGLTFFYFFFDKKTVFWTFVSSFLICIKLQIAKKCECLKAHQFLTFFDKFLVLALRISKKRGLAKTTRFFQIFRQFFNIITWNFPKNRADKKNLLPFLHFC